MIQVTHGDMIEEDASGGKIQNGATVRASLAVRNCVLANCIGGNLRPDLRIVLQMSNPRSVSLLPVQFLQCVDAP